MASGPAARLTPSTTSRCYWSATRPGAVWQVLRKQTSQRHDRRAASARANGWRYQDAIECAKPTGRASLCNLQQRDSPSVRARRHDRRAPRFPTSYSMENIRKHKRNKRDTRYGSKATIPHRSVRATLSKSPGAVGRRPAASHWNPSVRAQSTNGADARPTWRMIS